MYWTGIIFIFHGQKDRGGGVEVMHAMEKPTLLPLNKSLGIEAWKENTADLGIKSNMGAVNNTKKDQCMKADITGHKKRRVCDCKPSLLMFINVKNSTDQYFQTTEQNITNNTDCNILGLKIKLSFQITLGGNPAYLASLYLYQNWCSCKMGQGVVLDFFQGLFLHQSWLGSTWGVLSDWPRPSLSLLVPIQREMCTLWYNLDSRFVLINMCIVHAYICNVIVHYSFQMLCLSFSSIHL